MPQLAFPFEHCNEYLAHDFILSSSNRFAYESIIGHQHWPCARLLLLGESGSGKTHLARIWQEQTGAAFLYPGTEMLLHNNYPAVIIDDIAQWHTIPETLLYVLNKVSENGGHLLLTAKHIPQFELADLQSRLNATYTVEIYTPDQPLIKAVIAKQLTDRCLSIKPEVLEYLSHHAERSFASIQKLIEVIDHMVMQEKRGITVPLIRKILNG